MNFEFVTWGFIDAQKGVRGNLLAWIYEPPRILHGTSPKVEDFTGDLKTKVFAEFQPPEPQYRTAEQPSIRVKNDSIRPEDLDREGDYRCDAPGRRGATRQRI